MNYKHLYKQLFFYCILLLLLIGQTSFAKTQNNSKKSPGYVELPLRLLSVKNPMPIVTIDDGKNKTDFFLDTGADINLTLTQSDLKKLNAKPTGKDLNSATNYGKYKSKEYVIKSWNLGGFKLSDVRCEELSDTRKNKEPFVTHSTIGLGLLRKYAILVDYTNHKLVLYSPDNYQSYIDTSSWIKVESPYDPLGIVIDGIIGTNKYRLCIDTGCVAYDNGTKCSYNVFKGINRKAFNQPMKSIDGMSVVNSVSMKLGEQTLPNLNFMFLDFVTEPEGLDGFLGSDFLDKYKVLVDFKRNCVFIHGKSSQD